MPARNKNAADHGGSVLFTEFASKPDVGAVGDAKDILLETSRVPYMKAARNGEKRVPIFDRFGEEVCKPLRGAGFGKY